MYVYIFIYIHICLYMYGYIYIYTHSILQRDLAMIHKIKRSNTCQLEDMFFCRKG